MSTDRQDHAAERWTPETEELAANAIFAWSDHEPAERRAEARSVLAALAEAGLLLPPGGETREEWGIQHPTLGVDGPVVHYEGEAGTSEALARRMAAASGNLVLVRRTFHATRWSEVPNVG